MFTMQPHYSYSPSQYLYSPSQCSSYSPSQCSLYSPSQYLPCSLSNTHHVSPWYKCNGWLGVKHQVTYSPYSSWQYSPYSPWQYSPCSSRYSSLTSLPGTPSSSCSKSTKVSPLRLWKFPNSRRTYRFDAKYGICSLCVRDMPVWRQIRYMFTACAGHAHVALLQCVTGSRAEK